MGVVAGGACRNAAACRNAGRLTPAAACVWSCVPRVDTGRTARHRRHLKQERDEAKRAFDAAKAQLKRLIAAAAELPALDVVHPRYGKTYQALRMEWKLTDDVEELEASIQDLEVG